jgi:hypothetical protein
LVAAADGCSGHLKQAKVFARKSGGYVRVKIVFEGKLRGEKKIDFILCSLSFQNSCS